ncbi:MAG: beta-galactosidase [Bryobacteraceae bacterium]|nr:beta-galactosidase [Bryobacteraceae bacterium]
MRTKLVLQVLLALGVVVPTLNAQFEPFGVDVEHISVSHCGPNVYRQDQYGSGYGYCPQLEKAARAGVQWVRLYALWRFIEPTQGQFNFDYQLDYMVEYARSKGMKVYITAIWAPAWARGSTCVDCSPLAFNNSPECLDAGYAVVNPDYTYNFFYTMAQHYRNKYPFDNPVKAYGVWNEPDHGCMYNARNLSAPPGNYLNEFVMRYLFPAYNGIKAGDPNALVVGPELMEDESEVSCGTYNHNELGSRCDWYDSWMKPLWNYFGGLFDVISLHLYRANHDEVKSQMERVNGLVLGQRPLWLTEMGYTQNGLYDYAHAEQMRLSYVDLFNRQPWWAKIFYSSLRDGDGLCNGSGLLCGETALTEKQAYWTYKQMTGH